MAEAIPPTGLDPFAPTDGPVARLAARARCTEGQLYSMGVGVLLLVLVSVNGLPHVAWDRSGGVASPVALPAGTPAAAPSAGIVTRQPVTDLFESPPPSRPSTPTPGAPPDQDRPVDPDGTPTGPREPPNAATTPTSTPAVVPPAHGGTRVVSGGYASAAAGTPLATVGVPEGSVAVARRAGRDDKVAYLRIEGTGGSLELLVDRGGVTTLDTLAGLELCFVTDAGWSVGAGDVSLADAPAYDCADAVTGTRAPAGDRWVFDLTGRDLDKFDGVAVIPAAAAPTPEFQIVFRIAADS